MQKEVQRLEMELDTSNREKVIIVIHNIHFESTIVIPLLGSVVESIIEHLKNYSRNADVH